jgi:hypothetical protein
MGLSTGILTAMILAVTHGQPAPPFSTALYATASAVIPVLFLAIAVQGRLYDDMLKAFVTGFRRSKDDFSVRGQGAAW